MFNSLRSKLTFATSLTASIIFGVVVAYSVVTSREEAIKSAEIEYHEKAKRLSLLLKGVIDNSFSKLQTQNVILKTLDRKGKLDKYTTLELVQSNLSKNKDYVGMCAIFEPQTLCINDTSFSYLMDKGIFIPYLYYNQEGGITIAPLIDYDKASIGDYYLIPKQTKKPLLTEPYFYPLNDKNVLMVTLSQPILDNDIFWGLTTIDYDIQFIQHFCKNLSLEVNNGNSNVAVISNNGIIVANSADSSLIGKDIDEIYANNTQQQFANIKEGKEDIHFQDGYLILEIPILFSETETPWRVHVAVPGSDIFSEAEKQTYILIIIGIILISIAVAMINILTGKLILPLFKLVDNTKDIAQGNLSVEITTNQKDEVGVLAVSFKAMVVRLREVIEALQNSIKQVEEKNIELADKEEKFRKLFEEASDAILLLHENGKIFDCNKSANDSFILGSEDLLGKTVVDVSPKYQADKRPSKEKAFVLLGKTLKNQPQRFEWDHINGEGKLFTVSISLNKIELSGITYVQAILRDITEKVQKDKELEMYRSQLEDLVSKKTNKLKIAYEELQAFNEILNEKSEIIHNQNQKLKTTLQHLQEAQTKLLHSDKMASLGILTAGVAHEINNPLNFIMGAYDALLRNYKNNSFSDNYEEIGVLINALKTGVERSSAIVQSLNQFSRKSDSHNEDCNLHEIIDNSLTMLRHQIKSRITIYKKFFHSDIIIKGNIGNLHQVFINILSNAIQSIDAEGIISLRTDLKKEKVIVEVTDSGGGISFENLKRVTDPFFTTKEPGKGTGLGLSIVYKIIKEHKGELEFKSELGKGTTVIIEFIKEKRYGH